MVVFLARFDCSSITLVDIEHVLPKVAPRSRGCHMRCLSNLKGNALGYPQVSPEAWQRTV